MAEFAYAKGRVSESVQFISQEMKEFDNEYINKGWEEYKTDTRLQKLMDRTVENILTALIEVCGTILTEKGIAAENYSEVLREIGKLFGFSKDEQEDLAGLAIQRNRLAHRYLDLRWQAVKMYGEKANLIKRLLKQILEYES